MADPDGSLAPVAVGHRFTAQHRFCPEESIAFALNAGDLNPLHHDAEYADASRYRGLIVSGTHTAALLLGLTASHFAQRASVVGIRFAVDFLQAVRADAAVTMAWSVTRVHRHPGGRGWFVDLSGELCSEDQGLCVTASGTVLVQAELSAEVNR